MLLMGLIFLYNFLLLKGVIITSWRSIRGGWEGEGGRGDKGNSAVCKFHQVDSKYVRENSTCINYVTSCNRV